MKYVEIDEVYVQNLAELLFGLASSDRLTLLHELEGREQRLAQLAPKISATVQETSKHLARLAEADLVQKKKEGFTLTPLGKAVIALMPSLRFLADHRNFFRAHLPTSLPIAFVERIGELEEGLLGEKLIDVLSFTEKVYTEAEEYVWVMADQNPFEASIVSTLGPRKIRMKAIIPRTIIKPEDLPELRKSVGSELEVRTMDKLCAALIISEKASGVVFQDEEGALDFDSGFRGTSARFRGWCSDLFNHYWGLAGRVSHTMSD